MIPTEVIHDLNAESRMPVSLGNDRVELVPVTYAEPSSHSKQFLDMSRRYPEVYDFLPWGPFDDEASFADFLAKLFRQNEGFVLFAILDKTRQNTVAGVIGHTTSTEINQSTEIGGIIIFPPFQRTHIASNAVGLLLAHALDLPAQGGLGLRRVVWQTNSINKGSIRLAERMGFRLEGIKRWDYVLPVGKEAASNGIAVRRGDLEPSNAGRDTAILSLCWDDWESGARERVFAVMARIK